MYCPSADQMGEAKLIRSLRVIRRGLVPSALATHTFFDPFRSLTNTSCLPSGENRGC